LSSHTFYGKNADALYEQYQSLSAEEIHSDWLDHIPNTKALILDVGAGSGRDAFWLAGNGHEVVAVEPSDELRERAQAVKNPAVLWIKDSLPSLTEVYKLDNKYELILLSAVWNHIAPNDRERAFRKLANLLKPGGKLVVTLRRGPSYGDRTFYDCSSEELHAYARKFMLHLLLEKSSADKMGRPDVSWTTIIYYLPDDGTFSLPLLRHIIINDKKSSTYKLALLRVLLRIADGSQGLIIEQNENHVVLPFGLVALFWMKTYKPLLDKGYRQQPDGRYGFAKEAFAKIGSISPYDLRVGARFTGQDAKYLATSLKDIRDTIKTMPAFYITYPNSKRQVFKCTSRKINISHDVYLNSDFLKQYGTFAVPRDLWNAFSLYACWIEPAIIKEWCDLMGVYDSKLGLKKSLDDYFQALSWFNVERATHEVRAIVESVRAKGKKLYCIWSDMPLKDDYAIDHCLPFSYWPNNDLWNLLPTRPRVNNAKSSRLPSAELLEKARERLFDWWDVAYNSEIIKERFFEEAKAALPIVHSFSYVDEFSSIFSGIQNQRLKLKVNQQIQEWDGI
jgi:SAM-dependent methyltransferase